MIAEVLPVLFVLQRLDHGVAEDADAPERRRPDIADGKGAKSSRSRVIGGWVMNGYGKNTALETNFRHLDA